jgi:hypothetical protein
LVDDAAVSLVLADVIDRFVFDCHCFRLHLRLMPEIGAR